MRPRILAELKVHPTDLAARIAAQGDTPLAFANRVDCAKSVLYRLINGERKRIDKKTAAAIERELKLENGEYFREVVRVRKVSPTSGSCRNCGTAA